jgi:hypothetical protein
MEGELCRDVSCIPAPASAVSASTASTLSIAAAAPVTSGCIDDLIICFLGKVLRGVCLSSPIFKVADKRPQVVVRALEQVLVNQDDVSFIGFGNRFFKIKDIDLFDRCANKQGILERLAALGDQLIVERLEVRVGEHACFR